jgi:hypothetical protein
MEYIKNPECKDCDEEGIIDTDCEATGVAVRIICDCVNEEE